MGLRKGHVAGGWMGAGPREQNTEVSGNSEKVRGPSQWMQISGRGAVLPTSHADKLYLEKLAALRLQI